jgi:hypothetical protein
MSERNKIFAHRINSHVNEIEKLNFMLSSDMIQESDGQLIAELNESIVYHYPKWKGICYKKTNLSILEVFAMLLKQQFYYPNFLSTPLIFDERELKYIKQPTLNIIPNVVLEIDTRDFYENSAMFELPLDEPIHLCGCRWTKNYWQTKVKENLFSCYNAFEWIGLRLVNGTQPVISLKVIDPNTISVQDSMSEMLNLSWINNYTQHKVKSRMFSPSDFVMVFKHCIISYKKYQEKYSKTVPKIDFSSCNLDQSDEKLLFLDSGDKIDQIINEEEMNRIY